MITLFEEAAGLQDQLRDNGLEFFFVGGISLQVWGQPRLTTDIDLTVFTGLVDEDERIKWLLSRFRPLIGTEESTLQFARRRRVLLLQTESSTEIDVMLGGLADLSEELRRSSYQQFTPEHSLKICSADTLIAMKTVAGRMQDMADIETVVVKQDRIDWEYIDAYLDQVMEYEDITIKRQQLDEIRKGTEK